MPRVSLSILLYLHSVPVKVLLAKPVGCRIVLSGTMSFWHVVHLVSVAVLHQGLLWKCLFLSKAV